MLVRIAVAALSALGLCALVALPLVAGAGGGWRLAAVFCLPLVWVVGCVVYEARKPAQDTREQDREAA